MNLHSRLEMAGQALLALLDPDKDLMPTGGYEIAHDLGRWWDAAIRLEETIGFVIPADLEGASLRNLQRLTDNPDGLLMNRLDAPWLRVNARINPHNFRESLLAFAALVRCRRSAWARQAGLHVVRTMDRCLRTDGSFDFRKLGSWGHVPLTQDPSHTEKRRDGWFDGTATSGRSLEALVWFFEDVGESEILTLARRIAEHHLEYSTNEDGTVREEIVDPENVGHTHSYLGTLLGLLLFGLLTGQRQYVDVVEATYRNAVRERIVTATGWAPHDLGTLRFPNDFGDPVGEPASTGDAAQLALWLALRAGCLDLLDDVERYVRARLLPAQLTGRDAQQHPEVQFTPPQLGAWGVYGPSHAGKRCTPDVLAAVTHSLCDIYKHICTRTQAEIRINLHFDCENSHLKIVSERKQQGKLSVFVKRPGSIMIRIPQWVPDASLELSVDGRKLSVRRLGTFAWISRDILTEGSRITMSYDLPERWTKEPMPSGRCYHFKWRGDEILGVSPQDEPLPFYPGVIRETATDSPIRHGKAGR